MEFFNFLNTLISQRVGEWSGVEETGKESTEKFNICFSFDSRMKEKYEHEIRELENSEKGLKDKYIETRTRLSESDANHQNLKAVVTQMELQLSHSTKVGCAVVSPRVDGAICL